MFTQPYFSLIYCTAVNTFHRNRFRFDFASYSPWPWCCSRRTWWAPCGGRGAPCAWTRSEVRLASAARREAPRETWCRLQSLPGPVGSATRTASKQEEMTRKWAISISISIYIARARARTVAIAIAIAIALARAIPRARTRARTRTRTRTRTKKRVRQATKHYKTNNLQSTRVWRICS